MTNKGFAGFPADTSSQAALDTRYRATGYLNNNFYYFASGQTNPSTGTLTTGALRLHPWLVPNPITVTRLGAEVTTTGDSGSKFRIGVYADTGYGYPGALVLDAGTIAGDSNTVQEIVVTLGLQAGLYWIGGGTQVVTTTQPTMRTNGSVPGLSIIPMPFATQPVSNGTSQGVQQASVTGALPAVFSSTVTPSGSTPRIFFKVG